jgi:hypothetical protein
LWIDRSLSGETGSRYETYESMTGGESWALRETSGQPLRKGPRPTAAADLRLRTDAATRSYRVERRTPAGWESVASFLVRVGECRQPEVTFPPEPPTPPGGAE